MISTTTDGSLAGIVEKPAEPPTSLANVSSYAFDPDVFEYIDRTPESQREEYEITTTLKFLLDSGREISVVQYDGVWLDIGRPRDLLTATDTVLSVTTGGNSEEVQHIEGVVEEGVYIYGPVTVE